MNKLIINILLAVISLTAVSQNKNAVNWSIISNTEINLNIDEKGVLPYSDNIEMSGKRVAGIISYSIDEKGKLEIEREVFFPQLHHFKTSESSWFHDYRAYLQDVYTDDVLPKLYINNEQFVPGKVEKVSINGMLNFEHASSKNGLVLLRTFFPSMDERMMVEQWTIKNTTSEEMKVVSGNTSVQFEDLGTKGIYARKVVSDAPAKMVLDPGESTSFSIKIMAKIESESFPAKSAQQTKTDREYFLKQMSGSLKLETPDPVLNTLFEFSKIRASESIFESELGLIHSPGGGRYYVGIWANDQAEYVSPLFPYMGYEVGNESAMNCYRAFADETNPEYNKIRYAFEIEGLVKPFLKDRGDAAMIAYGAAHFAMATGDEKVAKELWPLIEWCLEYCNRQLNDGGVVASESDEMEGRIETGTANLSTSSLYYGALNHAVDLGRDLGMKTTQINKYKKQVKALGRSMENYFGAKVEGLDTYKYYKEHKHLRHWICLPLVVGIHSRKEATIEALFDRLWTDNGVYVEKNNQNPKISEIFWDRGTLYALRGTFAAGATEKSLDKLQQFSEKRLIGDRVPYVVEASPEGSMAHLSAESGLYCRIFTEGLFGINPTGLKSFELTPHLPKDWDQMALQNIKAFGECFDVIVKRDGEKINVEIEKNGKQWLSKYLGKEGKILISF